MASPQLQIIVEALRARPVLTGLSIEEHRAAFAALASQFRPAEDVRREPADAGGVPGEWVTTPESVRGRVIYYLHGGGYVVGSIDTHCEFISRLSRAAHEIGRAHV